MGTSQSRNRLIGGANLIRAASDGDTATVRQLLALRRQLGININARSRRARDTALMAAARSGHADIVELLLAAGANVNAQNRWGKNALHYAAIYDHADIVELLLAAGAAIGSTTLMEAIEEGRTEIVRLLLAAGADVNVTDSEGYTALHYAAEFGRTEMAELLLAQPGIDVTATARDGNTALMWADKAGNAEIARAINSFLAAQAMNRWIPRHRSRQRDRFGLSELDRGTTFRTDRVYRYIQQFL